MAKQLGSDSENEHSQLEEEVGSCPWVAKAKPFSEYEKTLLLELVTEHKAIIEDKRTDYGTNNKKKEIWTKISSKFSSDNGVQKRSASQLKNWWLNSKKRAKKDVSTHRKKLYKTGGGKKTPDLKPETVRIMSLVPSQMKSLENKFDSDGVYDNLDSMDVTNDVSNMNEDVTNNESQEVLLYDEDGTVIQSDIPVSTLATVKTRIGETPTITKRKREKDPRSSLVDMEYAEHQLRLKTLRIEYEDAVIRRDMNRNKMAFKEAKYDLELKILQKALDK